eukprot:gene7686-biopygen18063
MGPIDGRKMQFWMRSSTEWCRGYPPLSLTVGIRSRPTQNGTRGWGPLSLHWGIRKSCRIPSRNGMPRTSCLKYFWSILITKTTKIASKHAPQRRVYARSVQKDLIDGRKTYFEECDPENTGNHQKCMHLSRIPSRNGMPRMSFFEAFWRILLALWHPKLAKSGLKDAPQRRGYTRSLPMGPIDGTHGRVRPRKHRKSSTMQEIMPGVVQEWHAKDVICEALWRIVQALWHPKLAKSGLKDAPQRRGYTRSLLMGPIDGSKPHQRWLERRAAATGIPARARKKWPSDGTHGGSAGSLCLSLVG